MSRPQPLFIYGPLGATMIALDQALVCPACRKASFRFVNRDGSTVCCECDLPRQREHEMRAWKENEEALCSARSARAS